MVLKRPRDCIENDGIIMDRVFALEEKVDLIIQQLQVRPQNTSVATPFLFGKASVDQILNSKSN